MKAFEKTFEQVFNLPEATKSLNFSGRTDTSLVRECFALHGIAATPRNFASFFEAYPLLLESFLGRLPGGVCAGVHEFMERLLKLPERPLMGLLTGNIRRGAELKLRHYQLWERFETGAYGDDHEDRNCIAGVARQRAEEHLGKTLPGEEILVIGDTPRDIECGRSIGARVIGVGTGHYTPEELRAAGATLAVETLTGLDPSEWNGKL